MQRAVGSIDDCPVAEVVSYKKATPFLTNYPLNDFILDLKTDMGRMWCSRFDFSTIKPSKTKENTWIIQVAGRKLIPDGYFSFYEYPDWCAVSELKELSKVLDKKQYTIEYYDYCSTIDFYDCWFHVTRGNKTISFYWLQF